MSDRRIEIKNEDGSLAYILQFANIRDSRKLYTYGNSDHNFFLMRGAVQCEVKGGRQGGAWLRLRLVLQDRSLG